MGCLLHPKSHNIPAVAGEDLWFCGSCGTPIKGKDIKGGKRIRKETAVRRWKIFKTRPKQEGYETRHVTKGGEFLKGDSEGGYRRLKGKKPKKKKDDG